MGSQWSKIAQKLPGRTDSSIKNYFYSKLRQGLRKINDYQKIRQKQHFQNILLSKILSIEDGRRKGKLDIKNQAAEELARQIKKGLIHNLKGQEEKFMEELVDRILEFNKVCKRKRMPKPTKLTIYKKFSSDGPQTKTSQNHFPLLRFITASIKNLNQKFHKPTLSKPRFMITPGIKISMKTIYLHQTMAYCFMMRAFHTGSSKSRKFEEICPPSNYRVRVIDVKYIHKSDIYQIFMKKEQDERTQKIRNATVIYEEWPKPGLSFLDIFPLIGNPELLSMITDIFAEHLATVEYDHIYMLESRGFLFGVPLSQKVNKPCRPFRKKGKLPGEVARQEYDLEYGSDVIEIQKNILKPGEKVIIVDDVLATGGTMNAAIKLIQSQGGVVERVVLVNIVAKLNGIAKLLVDKEKVFYIFDI